MKSERCLQHKKLERTLVLGFEHNLCLDCKEEIIIPKPNKDKEIGIISTIVLTAFAIYIISTIVNAFME
jgi:hypothetical protein